MLEHIRALIRAALDERSAQQAALDEVLAAPTTEARDLNDAESASFTEARTAILEIDERLAAYRTREAELVDLAEREAAASEARASVLPEIATVTVRSEARTYRPDGEHNFLADAYRSRFHGDRAAADRIERHRTEAQIDYRSTTGNFGGLVVPQYMTNLYAANLASGRPFLNAVTSMGLPDAGMTVTIPRGTTAVGVAAQETQNTGVSNTTAASEGLSVPVRTFAGQQVLSRQAFERGEDIGGILLADLFNQYATKTNISAISGNGTVGGHWGIINTTSVQTASWTGTTGASLVASIHNAVGKINGARYAAPDLIVMHPRRWAWLCAQSDTAGRPLVQISGYSGDNVVGAGAAAGYGAVGSVAGIPVVSDAGVPVTLGTSTDEDRIIVTRRADVLHMEDAGAPVGLTFEEVLGDQLSVRLVAYGFSAFTAGRYPVASCIIQGTGLMQVLS